MREHILENQALSVTIADTGAELIRVYDRDRQAERIWGGDPSVWNRHAPILFPFVGKVTGGKYRVGGREYPMPTQHGFARDRVFACVDEGPASLTHRLESDDWTRERYPFDFRLDVTHRLSGRRLDIEWTIENTGAGEMRFFIGGHPGFLPPEGVRKEDCRIVFPGRDSLDYLQANPAGFVLPERKTLALQNGGHPYQADIPDTWIFEDGQVKSVGIAAPDGRPFVMMNCEQFPMLAVWANPKGPFICLEPWFGRTDDEGFDGSMDQKKDVQRLAAGDKKTIAYSIEFL